MRIHHHDYNLFSFIITASLRLSPFAPGPNHYHHHHSITLPPALFECTTIIRRVQMKHPGTYNLEALHLNVGTLALFSTNIKSSLNGVQSRSTLQVVQRPERISLAPVPTLASNGDSVDYDPCLAPFHWPLLQGATQTLTFQAAMMPIKFHRELNALPLSAIRVAECQGIEILEEAVLSIFRQSEV